MPEAATMGSFRRVLEMALWAVGLFIFFFVGHVEFSFWDAGYSRTTAKLLALFRLAMILLVVARCLGPRRFLLLVTFPVICLPLCIYVGWLFEDGKGGLTLVLGGWVTILAYRRFWKPLLIAKE